MPGLTIELPQPDGGCTAYVGSSGVVRAVAVAVEGQIMKTDSDLKSDVLAELAWDPIVPEAKVGVSVSDGVVTLTGHLDTYAEKIAAQRAAQRVSGVKAIAVELDVKVTGPHKRTDTEIAAAAEHAIEWNTMVPADRVQITVQHGWVTLNGELDWDYQRRSVERMVRPLMGVTGVTDNIQLKQQPSPADLTATIQGALTRQALREAKRIDISIQNGAVTLRGPVHSWAERSAVEGAVWSAPGVTSVLNRLSVER